MSKTIDFGIDLGTTNSAIAQFRKGEVEVFKNPLNYGSSTVPSVVSFKKDKVVVGDKAKEYLAKRPTDVVGLFKRKMGTAESFPIKALGDSVTPVDLSAYVLRELKGFVQSGDTVDAAVVTIPASFDTIQSNATKEAAHAAGIAEVVLLQEPIAASLAYANKSAGADLADGRWLVYDLGGGTFDVALIEIKEGEMTVADHEGDNFLGGADFDRLIVDRLVVSEAERRGSFDGLLDSLRSASGTRAADYQRLLRFAEDAKIALSGTTSAEIDVAMEDDDGDEIDEEVTVTRSEFEALIRDDVDRTVDMVKVMLARNGMTASDIQFVLMVGGSTYIPYVRSRVGEVLRVKVVTDVDPTTAVAVGAAHYAGTKRRGESPPSPDARPTTVRVQSAYQRASKEDVEFVALRFDGDLNGLSYRITRDDGGYDSGLKPVAQKVADDLPLVPNTYNYFTLAVTDAVGNPVATDAEPIGIAHGKFQVTGQPLPHDICIDRDVPGSSLRRLEVVFRKNETLPLRRTVTFALNRTVGKGSDDAVVIRVSEGPSEVQPDSNQTVGFVEVSGKALSRDAVRGSDVEITLDMSESRDLTASAYFTMTDQEFTEVFKPQVRSAPPDFVREIANDLASRLKDEIETATEAEDYEAAQELKQIQRESEAAAEAAAQLVDDDTTDQRYQIEDRVRTLSQRADAATKDKSLNEARQSYEISKGSCEQVVAEHGNDKERRAFEEAVAHEATVLSSSSPKRVRDAAKEFDRIAYSILIRTPAFLVGMFEDLVPRASRMNDPEQAQNLVSAGQFAIQQSNWDRLREVNSGLINLLPRREQSEVSGRIGF